MIPRYVDSFTRAGEMKLSSTRFEKKTVIYDYLRISTMAFALPT